MSRAQAAFDRAFHPLRVPRSEAYRRGCLDCLKVKFRESEKTLDELLPYELGTAEADAWFAGVDEGRLIFRVKQEKGQVA